MRLTNISADIDRDWLSAQRVYSVRLTLVAVNIRVCITKVGEVSSYLPDTGRIRGLAIHGIGDHSIQHYENWKRRGR